ncbi:MAG: hypothetical protein GEU26_16975, partial [Nitrososphaeraceae archaeon]|nr:hypothetical protein [Nitrososphaeraceae archaeon]
MNQSSITRSIMLAIVMAGIVFSVSSLVVGHMVPTADATKPKHRDNNDDNGNNDNRPTGSQNVVTNPGSSTTGGDMGIGSFGDSGSSGSDMAAQQLTTPMAAQAASSNAACGQVVSGVVN